MIHTSGHGPMIELRRLHRFFGRTHAVNDISFVVEKGEVLGYIGPNGAGKTTSMRILATLELPTYGDAYVDGFSCVNDPDRVRKRLGFMPDYFGTYSNVNCLEYLDFFARAYGLIGRERHHAIQYVMKFTGLDVLAEKPIRGLSKGMKQRLCLGRSMIHNPAVLILDEPAAGLDPRARIELREMIRALAADGKSILISSHILTELGEMCDRVAIIERGQLLASGSVEEIQRGHNTKRYIQARVLYDVDRLVNWLEARPGILELNRNDLTVSFFHDGNQEDEVALLREMVQAGFPVAEFLSKLRSLEDVFLQVTRGIVQ
jgi:ABC-2 type transport system ATP-binding protein